MLHFFILQWLAKNLEAKVRIYLFRDHIYSQKHTFISNQWPFHFFKPPIFLFNSFHTFNLAISFRISQLSINFWNEGLNLSEGVQGKGSFGMIRMFCSGQFIMRPYQLVNNRRVRDILRNKCSQVWGV